MTRCSAAAGRKVHAAYQAYDGSRRPTPTAQCWRAATFAVPAVVVMMPFLRRRAARPGRPSAACGHKGSLARTRLARELTWMIAVAPTCHDRTVHVVADGD